MPVYFPGNGLPAGQFGGSKYPKKQRIAATRCSHNPRFDLGKINVNSQSYHVACARIKKLWMLFQNFYVGTASGSGDVALGAGTIAVTIGSPSGGWTTVPVNGLATGPLAAGGYTLAGPIDVDLLSGEGFYVRSSVRGSTGIVYRPNGIAGVDIATLSAGALSDTTTGGAITSTQSGSYYAPTAIIAETTTGALAYYGNSRGQGFSDTPDAEGGIGHLERALIAAGVPFTNLCQQSDRLMWAVSSPNARLLIAQYADVAITEYGINDLNAGARTAAQLLADMGTFAGMLPIPVYAETLLPKTLSSDSFTTVAGQTTASFESQRVTVNDTLRRGGVRGIAGFFDAADAVESARNSGKWKVDSTAFAYTPDGLHGSALAGKVISAAFQVRRFI